MTTLIFAHPWHGSFNKAIFDIVRECIDQKGRDYQVIDLNKDGFNPIMTELELGLFAEGKYSDSLVGKYQEMLRITDELIIIFPIWWFSMPAILKGFLIKLC
ncbi:NAD(P)H-dependent oxidoreductase [endosymbiont 'TC1' of Trimyema compressum]|uniref:NAD(P)H-dependent oxidoreductase n=1 Tax=endosymbiont 'TC1' of Trimyema compressum TaxID=243899 RepID=UPI000B0F804D